MPRDLTSAQIARLRLQALGLVDGVGPPRTSPRDVVAHHLAMQAQDWGASRWAIGSRLAEASDADVLAAYDSGAIVRSWPMRGTVHVILAEDLPWLLELAGTRALAGVQRRWDSLGIDEAMLERAREVTVERLRGGRRCTRAELVETLTEADLDLTGQRAYHTVWYLAQTGTLVQGPTAGGEHLLVLLDEWIPAPRRLGRDDALAELGLRYLRARGPASIDDLAHWTKLGKRECAAAMAANSDLLVEVRRGGERLHMTREAFETLDPDSAAARDATLALAAFDEHLLGYRDRSDVLADEHATLVDPGRNGVFRWTIVERARVVATWSRTRRARGVVVELAPFRRSSAAFERRAGAAIARWGAFGGTPTALARARTDP
ncbi:MAG: winged helix DNA-binding domain-containing protein [Gaiella sp.]